MCIIWAKGGWIQQGLKLKGVEVNKALSSNNGSEPKESSGRGVSVRFTTAPAVSSKLHGVTTDNPGMHWSLQMSTGWIHFCLLTHLVVFKMAL